MDIHIQGVMYFFNIMVYLNWCKQRMKNLLRYMQIYILLGNIRGERYQYMMSFGLILLLGLNNDQSEGEYRRTSIVLRKIFAFLQESRTRTLYILASSPMSGILIALFD